jgi:SP family general alpha glucoside:H+ symporter-like MFS transporter
MCWGGGILLSSGVVRAMVGVEGDLGWQLPFALQWIWPIPLFIGTYLAPESPWNSVRRDNLEEARESLMRLRQDTPERETEVESTLAYIRHTTALEQAESGDASFWECFQGTNLRRTEIVRFSPFHTSLLSHLDSHSSKQRDHNWKEEIGGKG